MTIKKW